MFKTTKKYLHPNHNRQTLSASAKSLGKLVLLATTSVCGSVYAGKYLTNYLNALKSNDFEGMLVKDDNFQTSYVPIQSVSFNTGRKLLSSNNLRIGKLYDPFQINTHTSSIQYSPDITKLLNDNFVVVWQDWIRHIDGSVSTGINGQLFDINRNMIGPEFPVAIDYALSPAVTTLSNSNFVVLWTSPNDNTVNDNMNCNIIYGQIYNNTAVKINSKFKVINSCLNNVFYDRQVSTIALDNKFIVTWADADSLDGSGWGVYSKIFNNDGTTFGSQFRVNTYTTGDQLAPSIAALSNNNFIVVWQSLQQDGSGYGIYGQLFDNTGAKVNTEFRVNTYITNDQSSPIVAALPNDKFVITWTSKGQNGINKQVYGKIYTNSGNTVNSEFLVNAYEALDQVNQDITVLQNGDFIIIWQRYNDIYGQMYNKEGMAIGTEFQINTYPIIGSMPATISLSSNKFAVVWSSHSNVDDVNYVTTFGEIFGQLFELITLTPSYTPTATNSFSYTQTNTPSITFSSLSRLSSSASPQFSFSPKNSLSPPASTSPVSHSGYVVKSESSPSPSSSPLASSVKDYTSSACMNKPLLINFIKNTKTNTKELFNYARSVVNVWLDNSEERDDETIINKFSKLKI